MIITLKKDAKQEETEKLQSSAGTLKKIIEEVL